jgi:hypothetical protein
MAAGIPAGPGSDRAADEMEEALRAAARPRSREAEIAADDEGASATAETDEPEEGRGLSGPADGSSGAGSAAGSRGGRPPAGAR